MPIQHTIFLSMEPSTAVCVSLFSTKESTILGFETANWLHHKGEKKLVISVHEGESHRSNNVNVQRVG